MSEVNISAILNLVGVEPLVMATTVYIITNFIKKFIPTKLHKLVCLVPFIIAILVYGLYSYFILNEFIVKNILMQGVKVGGIATFLYAIFRQLISKGYSKETIVSNLLTIIISKSNLSSSVKKIISAYNDSTQNKQEAIFKIIAENSSISEQECTSITNIIIKTLDSLSKTTK